jgi:hypothetical protein
VAAGIAVIDYTVRPVRSAGPCIRRQPSDTGGDAKGFLNVAEVAAALDLGPEMTYRWCRSGRWPAVKVVKEWHIHRAALAALLRRGVRYAA